MTAAQAHILDLFRALTPSEREELLSVLANSFEDKDIVDDLTPEQFAAIEDGLAQAERGETVDSEVVFNELADRFGFSRS